MATMRVRVDRVVHASKDFYILSVQIVSANPPVNDVLCKAKGHLSGLLGVGPGVTMQLNGEWVSHPKFGRQFSIHCWAPWAPDGESALRFLHECVDGFLDYNLVRTICDTFEDETFIALSERQAACLSLAEEDHLAMPGQVKKSSMARALLAWDRLRTTYELLGVLQDHGLTADVIKDVFNRFGHDAKDIVSKNPYRLLEVRGFTMSQADRVAARMGIDEDDPRRVQGAVLATLRQGTGEGHLCVRQSDFPMLFPEVSREARVAPFPTRPSRVNAAVEALAVDKAVIVDGDSVYLPEYYRFERDAASMLAEFLTPVKLDVDPVTFLEDYERSHRIDLSNAQKDAVEKLLTSRVLVLTGLPGTGKTTVVKTIVNLFQAAGLSYKLMAPTGIAAKRMAAVTGREAATIHRTFGYDGENWSFNRQNKLTTDAVIVDEMSMVDQELFYRTLDALHPSTILVLVGDDAQLPSVGPGNVLRELIACPVIPNVRLTQIFRQSDKGGIVTNSHRINAGESLDLDEKDPSSEFRFVAMEDEEKTASLIVEMAAKLKARDANFQVLSPKYEGPVGVDQLNAMMRDKLNPSSGQGEWSSGDFQLREGDRVMVVQNDYQLGIYNGDMAKVTQFTRDSVMIKVHGIGPQDVDTIVPVPKKDAPYKLRLAYAVTVHKCVDSDTLVETPDGLVPAGSLPPEGVVATPTGQAAYRGFVRNPPAPMLEIETTDGYTLRVTPDHLVDRWSEGYVAARADALEKGDFLRLRLGHEFEGKTLARLPEPPTDVDVRAHPYKVPREVCSDVAEFLGMCVADVTVYDRGFRLAKRHEDYAERFDMLCRSLFGVEPRRFAAHNAFYVEVNSTLLSRWLLSIGGLAPNDKYIPPAVLSSPVSVQARFLRGLFEDGTVNVGKDGTLDHIELFSAYPDIIRRVKVMLLRLGIISGVVRKKNGIAVCLYGQYAHRFASKVGFISAFKSKRLDAPVGAETRYVVPVTQSEVREVMDANGGWSFMTYADKNALTRGTMSRHQVSHMLERASRHSPAWNALHERLRYHHSRVREVRPYFGPSVCVEVPDGHQFIQDGFCAWNSQGSEWETIVLPIVRSQRRMLQRNLFYTAVTRAKKKVWLLGHGDAVGKAIANDMVVQRNTAFGRAVAEAQAALGVRAGVGAADGEPEQHAGADVE